MIHITSSGATTITTTSPRGIRINVNAALTGTITVTDGTGTLAIITNPTVLSSWVGYGFQGTVTVNPNATCDLSVSVLNRKE